MPRSPTAYWTYLQTLAWVRWRQPGVERYFKNGTGPDLWRACIVHPAAALAAPGLPNVTYDVVCQNPQAQLDQAVRDGLILAQTVDGLEIRAIETAVWGSLTLNKKSMTFHQGDLVPVKVLFDAAKVIRHWSMASEATIQRAGTEAEALVWLQSKMAQGPKRRGVTKESLRSECPVGVGTRAWDRVYGTAKKTADASWGASGPAKG